MSPNPMNAAHASAAAPQERDPDGLPLFRHPAPRPEWLALQREPILEPELALVDPHHHLWDLHGGYLLDELVADTSSGHRIVATVFSQCGWAYRDGGPDAMKPVGETARVAAIALEAEGRALPTRVCAGIVGFADMELGEAVAPVLQAHVEAGAGRFRGIRHITARDEGLSASLLGRPPADLMQRKGFAQGLKALQAAGLSFDAWLYFHQIPQLVAVARAFPELPIVLNHLGGPLAVGPYAGRRDEVFKTWSEHLKALAACPNVHMKLGGLGMVVMGFDFHRQATPPSSQVLADAWGPYMHKAIELFGARRCMFESNFPVDKAMCSYASLWNAYKRIASGASAGEKTALFRETANSFYRLGIAS
jgi:L-fuconolactonase